MKNPILATVLALVVGASQAAYPERPIKPVVPAGAGTQGLKAPSFAALREKSGLDEFSLCGDALTKYRNDEITRWGQVFKNVGLEKQ